MVMRIYIAITLAAVAHCVVFKDCTDGPASKYHAGGNAGPSRIIKSSRMTGPVTAIEISGCAPDTKVCTLPKGQNVTFTVHFIPAIAAKKVTADVHGIINGNPVPFPIPNPDACKDSGLTCPLVVGAANVYHTQLLVKPWYPSISLIVKFEVKNESSKDVFCIETPVKLAFTQENIAQYACATNRHPLCKNALTSQCIAL